MQKQGRRTNEAIHRPISKLHRINLTTNLPTKLLFTLQHIVELLWSLLLARLSCDQVVDALSSSLVTLNVPPVTLIVIILRPKRSRSRKLNPFTSSTLGLKCIVPSNNIAPDSALCNREKIMRKETSLLPNSLKHY